MERIGLCLFLWMRVEMILCITVGNSRTLNFEDILHYQKIIVALTETDRLMKEIDKTIVF